MISRRARRNRPWRVIHDASKRSVAVIPQQGDGWHVFIGNRGCGTFTSEAAAERFVDRIADADRHGGGDDR